jgi:hypothetical protein
LLLLGAYFRLGTLARDTRFHPDESLFATFSRQMVALGDYFLADTIIDKPPFTFWLTGNSLITVGESEFAARLPNALASLLALAVLYALTLRTTHRPSVANLALLLFALSPLDIAFAPTVFQDPPMLAAALLAALLVSRQQWGWGGLAMGFSIISKPTGLWLLPLVLGVGFISPMKCSAIGLSTLIRRAILFAGGMALPLGYIWYWDSRRHVQSFVELGAHHNNPGRWIRSEEVWPRLESWLELFTQVAATDWLAFIFLLVAAGWLVVAAMQKRRDGLISWLITAYVLAYMGIYWLVAFSPWNRYLYLLVPFVLIPVAQGIVWLVGRWRYGLSVTACAITIVSWSPAADATRLSAAPHTYGIDQLADTLNRDYRNTVVYDHWLGWSISWYMGRFSPVWLIYYPTPEDLANHLQYAEDEQYFIAPSAEQARPWVELLRAKGVGIAPVCRTAEGDYLIYRVRAANLVFEQGMPSTPDPIPICGTE